LNDEFLNLKIVQFVILSEASVSSGIRRIEAVTGHAALKETQSWHNSLLKISGRLNSPLSEVADRVESLQKKVQQLEKQAAKERAGNALDSIKDLSKKSFEINGITIICGRIDEADAKTIKKAVDDFKNKFKDSISLLGGSKGGKCLLVMGASGKALEKGFDCKKVLGEIAQIVDGGGGGRPDLAQAGGKDVSKLADAFIQAPLIIKRVLGN